MANIFRPSTWLGAGSSRRRMASEDAKSERNTKGSGGRVESAVDTAADTESQIPLAPNASAAESARPIREQIEARAYYLWREAGCPAGKDVDYWLIAEREILDQQQR